MDNENLYNNIRPYFDSEINDAIQTILKHDGFRGFLAKFLFPNQLDKGIEIVSKINSIKEFQDVVSSKFFELIIHQTIKDFRINGIDNLDPQKSYLFVSTHRDIVLDSALLQIAFYRHKFNTSRSAIGNNLVPSDLLKEVAKINKMFLVIRDGTAREMLENSMLLSSYIRKSILQDNESVWIAQRNGRTKDGDDKTQQGLLKMLAQSNKGSLIEGLQDLNIVPISISYEYESCDALKAREIVLSRRSVYVKLPGEDFNSINTGIMQNKGGVEINIGKPINDILENIESCRPANDMLKDITHLIDEEIYNGFKLWKTNYIAADMISPKKKYSKFYIEQDYIDFEKYVAKHIANTDVPKDEFKEVFLQIYAKPVFNKAKIR